VGPFVVPPPNYKDAASFQGFPEHLASRLRLKVANAACPGESSASLINATAQSFGCESFPPNATISGLPVSGPGYRKLYPLHVRYRGSQLGYAVSYLRKHRRTRLVSLEIGENDAGVCAATTSDGCASTSERAALFAKVRRNVRRILRAIRRKARYRGQLAIVHYYSPGEAEPFLSSVRRGINRAMDRAARGFRVRFADGYGEWKRAALRSGGDPCTAGLLLQLHGLLEGKCGFHPSYAGQALLSQALEKAIKLR
jgi:lysophospholipase L1-like esterase